MKIDNRKTFIKRLLSGTMSKEQRKIFIQLDEIDFQLRKQWDEAGNESIDWQMKEQIWRNIKNKQDNKNRRFFQMFPKWQMIAATVTLLLITSAGLWFAKQQAGCVNDFIEVTAQESQLYTLPDSSKVWMQKGSSLRYAKAFLKDRKVWLKGNSFFEVMRQNGVPFQVYINQGMIEVKGTSFDIHQNQNQQTNEIILFCGKVDFTAENHETIEMQPFQKLTYYIKKDNITKEWLRNIKYKNGSFQFTNLPLKQLIETINSRYNSNIKLEGINLKQQSAFTGKIRLEESLKDVLQKICYSLSLEMKANGNEIVIYKNNH